MGKSIVRKHVHNTDAQAVWKDLQEHMKSSLKEASEKRRLTQYVTNTVLDDNFKGTTGQLYSISMNNLGILMKSQKPLNCSLQQSNSSYFRML